MTQYCDKCGGIFNEKMTVEYGENGKPLHAYCAWRIWKEQRQKLEDDFNQRREVVQSSNSTLNLSEKTYGK